LSLIDHKKEDLPERMEVKMVTVKGEVRVVTDHSDPEGYTFTERYTYCSGYAVAKLVEALRYKPEDRGFDSRWGHWNFSVT
jgi:hypothetical protein